MNERSDVLGTTNETKPAASKERSRPAVIRGRHREPAWLYFLNTKMEKGTLIACTTCGRAPHILLGLDNDAARWHRVSAALFLPALLGILSSDSDGWFRVCHSAKSIFPVPHLSVTITLLFLVCQRAGFLQNDQVLSRICTNRIFSEFQNVRKKKNNFRQLSCACLFICADRIPFILIRF